MGNAHPFYRFSPANVNGGFEPGYSLQSTLCKEFQNLYSNGDLVGQTIGEAIKNFQFNIFVLNLPEEGGELRLVYPKPYPTISGTQTLIFNVQNDQLHAVDSTQKVIMTLDLVDGIVVDSVFDAYTIVTATQAYDDPIVDVELLVKRALEIYYQNGSAIFPITYSFDKTTGIATSSIARGKDWEVDLDTGVVGRYPAQSNPFAPVNSVTFSALSPSQNYILSLMERIISLTIADQTLTASDLINAINLLHLPDDYSIGVATDSSGATERVQIIFSGERSFVLMARTDGTFWYFQRFVIDLEYETDQLLFLLYYPIATELPYEPVDAQLYISNWYDMDLIQFDNGCEPEEVDTFQMPIKTGDTYQFNIIPEQANLTGLTSCQIGLFDENLNFVSEIGQAKFGCLKPIIFVNNYVDDWAGWNLIRLEINSNIADPATYELGIYFGFGSTSEHILAIPLPTVALTTDAQLAAFIESLSTDDYTVSVELVATGDEFLPFYGIITVTTCALDCQIGDYQVQLAVNLIGDPPLPPYTNQFVQQTENATQFLATVTIPSAPDGCYVFGLYDDNYPYQSIFAFSNTLYLNNEDCFSSMWQFGSSEDAIIEGFEYYYGWMQQLRLPINGAGQKPKIEESIYRNSDGTYQRPSNYSDLTLDLHSDYLDLETRNAVFSATRCPILIFEDKSIFVSGDLDVATVQDFSNKTSYRKLAQMKFSALIQGFQPNNNACIGC
jgi:hypothetical protein